MAPRLGLGSSLTLSAPVFETPILDAYSGAVAAYSLRKLKRGVGAVVRVRRDNDDAEADFTASEVTNGTLTTWTGSNDGFVKTLYDQTGNLNHMTAASDGAQPKIVNGGALLTNNGKVTMVGDGDTVLQGTAISLTGDMAFAIVGVFNESGQDAMMIGGTVSVTGNGYFWLHADDHLHIENSSETGFQDFTITSPLEEQKLWFVRRDGTTIGLSIDGTEVTATELVTQEQPFVVSRIFGGYASNYDLDGEIQEIILYNSDQTSNRTGIEANINDYYSIY